MLDHHDRGIILVGCLYELILTHMESVINTYETDVMEGDDLLKRLPKKRV